MAATDSWKTANLDGTYYFVEMYRDYPVYKVKPLQCIAYIKRCLICNVFSVMD